MEKQIADAAAAAAEDAPASLLPLVPCLYVVLFGLCYVIFIAHLYPTREMDAFVPYGNAMLCLSIGVYTFREITIP
jgi:hypothetical protein